MSNLSTSQTSKKAKSTFDFQACFKKKERFHFFFFFFYSNSFLPFSFTFCSKFIYIFTLKSTWIFFKFTLFFLFFLLFSILLFLFFLFFHSKSRSNSKLKAFSLFSSPLKFLNHIQFIFLNPFKCISNSSPFIVSSSPSPSSSI